MSWTFTLSRIGNVPPQGVDVDLLEASLHELLRMVDFAYQGYVQRSVLESCVKDFLGRKFNPSGILKPVVGSRDDFIVAFKTGGAPQDVLTLNFGQWIVPHQASVDVLCPSCGNEFHPDAKQKWTEAHNVIPASLWFKIVPDALIDFIEWYTDASSPDDKKEEALAVEAIKAMRNEYRRKGFKDSSSRSGKTIQMFIATLCQAGAATTGSGATGPLPSVGAQCPACEALHGSDSLIRRVETYSTLRYIQNLGEEMVGKQFISFLERGGFGVGWRGVAVKITHAISTMVLVEMLKLLEKRGVQKSDGGEWLKGQLIKNWSGFCTSVSEIAILRCSE